MTPKLFHPADLPAPELLRRRHLAYLVLDESVGGCSSDLRMFGTGRSSADEVLLWYENGSGDDYGLVVLEKEALLWVFDHECPFSPWVLYDSGVTDWPGMLDGLPEHLAAHLPHPIGPGEPRSVSGCYWYTDGAWSMGDPELPDEGLPEWYPPGMDPQGADLLVPLLVGDGTEAARFAEEYYERPELADAARNLVELVEAERPLTREALDAMSPQDGAEVMLSRARALGLAT